MSTIHIRSLLLGLCLLLLQQGQSSAMEKGLPDKVSPLATQARLMTQEEKEDFLMIGSETKPGAPYRLDLANPKHYRFILNTFARVGETPEKSPEFFRRLKKGHDDGMAANAAKHASPQKATLAIATAADGTPTPQDLNFIAQFSALSAPGSYQAKGLSSVVGGTITTLISMELYSVENGYVYATNQGKTAQYAQGTDFQVPVSGQTQPGLTDTTSKAQGMFAYVPVNDPNSPPIVVYYTSESTYDPTNPCMSQPNYCIRNDQQQCLSGQYQTACTNTVTNTTPIKVCYYRGSQQECDYWNPTSHPTNFVFPVSGNTTYPAPAVSPLLGYVNIALQNPLVGGGCNVYFQQLGTLDPTYWTSNGNTVNWNYPAAAFPNTGDCIAYYDGTNTYLWMTGSISLQGSPGKPPGYGAINFTSDRSQIGIKGVSIIPAMYIMQGCFAEGTKILQADGTTKAIQDFTGNHDEKIYSAQGATLLVTGTTRGTEPNKAMVRLKTANGHEILITETHPVITKGGIPVMAKDLKKGDVVVTKEGDSELALVGREKYAGQVHNLLLGTEQETDGKGATLYAEGILTGDARMQDYYDRLAQEKLKKDPNEVLKRLPKEWYEDFHKHH